MLSSRPKYHTKPSVIKIKQKFGNVDLKTLLKHIWVFPIKIQLVATHSAMIDDDITFILLDNCANDITNKVAECFGYSCYKNIIYYI